MFFGSFVSALLTGANGSRDHAFPQLEWSVMPPLQTNQIRICVGLRKRKESSSRKWKPWSGTIDPQAALSIRCRLT